MIYTIYRGTRANGEDKIGCDENYPNRPIQQNLTNYYIVEQHTDEMVASRRERECQKEAGLPVDSFPYHLRKIAGSKGGNSIPKQTRVNSTTNTWQEYTEEEKISRCNNISNGKKGIKATKEHKKALSEGSKIIKGDLLQEIRNEIAEHNISYRAISRKYNISTTVVYNIRDNKHGY